MEKQKTIKILNLNIVISYIKLISKLIYKLIYILI